ncbi:MAG: hypothetical protein HY537_02240, partial [Deltaproteobacteria bacterium]|nr:hypothetical protein [Deltaproteobacteria bacterium]
MHTGSVSLRIIIPLFVFSVVVGARTPEHGATDRMGRLDATTDCAHTRFTETHGTFTLYEASQMYKAKEHNEFRSSADKPIPGRTPYPLIAAREDYRSETVYPSVGYGRGSPYKVAVVAGWRYRAPDDSVFRLALAHAMLCEGVAKDSSFGTAMRSWLTNHDMFRMYLSKNGEKEDGEPDSQDIAKINLMTSLFDLFKKEVASNNPLIRGFLKEVFNQIRVTELHVLNGEPLSFTYGFKDQVELLRKLLAKADRTKEEKEFVDFFKEFSKEPRFSYLMHPLIASYAQSAINTGVLASDNRAMNKDQLNDIERQLQRVLGTPVNFDWIKHPSLAAGAIKGGNNSADSASCKDAICQILQPRAIGQVDFQIPDHNRQITAALEGFAQGLSKLSDDEKRRRIQKMQDELLVVLNSYDGLKQAPSPEFHGLRQTILHGISLLKPPQSDASLTGTIDRLSLNNPDQLREDRDRLAQIAHRAGAQYEPEALTQVFHYDPVLKGIID